MGDFSRGWLALREPADHAARSDRLARVIANAVGRDRERRIVDLGSGTGSNLRFLAPRLPRPQHWLLVDRDPELLALAGARVADGVSIETRNIELAEFGRDRLSELFDGAALVTASALLDLASKAWIEEIADACKGARAFVLFALTYDGRIECEPAEEHDELVRRLVNTHQRGDKGFGPALGPAASRAADAALSGHGYSTERERSDWVLAPDARELQRQLVDGWAEAARDVASPPEQSAIESWRRRRCAHIDAGRSRLIVGHEDLAATCDL